jgi:pimeloyl-ACP methyl ester carboxylesterase
MSTPRLAPRTQYLQRPEGRIAYDVAGAGPLIILIPGMGDLRSTYRSLATRLRGSGYRVACTDLRGHGDSDASFDRYGDPETAGDVAALIDELGEPAVLVGNSMGAGAAVIAAAHDPARVRGLVLVGPFVRDGNPGWVARLGMRVAMARPWAARVWRWYLPTLYAGTRPPDLDTHLEDIAASLARPGYARALHRTIRQTTHALAEAALAQVATPVLVVMGELDPDWPDPAAEARWIADAVAGELRMVADAGHYPHSQQPQVTGDAVLEFLAGIGHA